MLVVGTNYGLGHSRVVLRHPQGISAVVRVAAVVNVQDSYQLGVIVDGVPQAVLAAPSPPVALEWPA